LSALLGRLLGALARLQSTWPAPFLLAALALAALSIVPATRLELRSELTALLSPDDPSVIALARVLDDLGIGSELYVVLDAGGPPGARGGGGPPPPRGPKPMQLDGRIALVTGGTRGIGRGIAEAFLAEGARVVLSARSPEKGAGCLAELGAGERAHFVAGDVRVQADVERAVDETIARYGRIDVLVNNAGGSSGYAPVAELSDAAWRDAMAWILDSTFWATRRALRDMLPRRWGRVINISSVEGKQASKAAVAHYITAKHALNGFTKAVAFEYGAQGITSNAICPGAIETDLMRDNGPAAARAAGITYAEFLERYAQESAIKRLNTVAEVAAVAVLLASAAGGGITGALMDVDGGTGL
jgi:3-hydroxybutyrate dehydrogenase